MNTRIKSQSSTLKNNEEYPGFEEITLLEYLEYFKNPMLQDNAPVAIMTLA